MRGIPEIMCFARILMFQWPFRALCQSIFPMAGAPRGSTCTLLPSGLILSAQANDVFKNKRNVPHRQAGMAKRHGLDGSHLGPQKYVK